CHESIVARNYSSAKRLVPVSLEFDGDFRDVFEVRGHARPRRGEIERLVAAPDRVLLRYRGLDGQVRELELVFNPPPDQLLPGRAEWRLLLAPGGSEKLFVTARCDAARDADCRFIPQLRAARRQYYREHRMRAVVRTSNELFNELLARSMADLAMLTTSTPHG